MSIQAPATLAPGPQTTDVRWYFGQFVLWETQRRIEKAGHTVRLGPRSFDLLLMLVKRAGEFVAKEELLATVWAGVVVEEGSVRVHMSTLRKALGDPGTSDECREWITNVPQRGYRFNGRVRYEVSDASGAVRGRVHTPSFGRLPVRLTGLIGREADVQEALALLDAHRLVTVIGTGGIGKTSVAIRVAECYQMKYGTQVAFVDLAPLISQDHVLGTMARSLGAPADMPDTVQAIVQALAARDVLLVVDNCEHVLESLAVPLTALLTALPGLRILATSREALRVTGEAVFRLSALAVPDTQQPITLAESLRWSAVELLVERARAAGAGSFNESHAQLLARIAKQLDGLPLAIELVAARLGAQSVGDLALRLDDHLRLYVHGNRAALARHQSLAAALDWSIALLSEAELRLFRELSVFRGRFDVESALSVASEIDPDVAFDVLMSLSNKSLVFFDANEDVAPYRLLETTRAYAASLLERSEDHAAVLRRHATLILDLMKAATAELKELSEQAWGERYAYRLDDVRFAMQQSLSHEDAKTATALVIASAPLWFHLSQVEEYGKRVVAALALVDRQPKPDVEAATWLATELITALLHTAGPSQDLEIACDRALAGALAVKTDALELRARWGRCTHDMFRGEYAAAFRHAQDLLTFSEAWSDSSALILSHRASAMAAHFCGLFDLSRQHSAAALGVADSVGHTRANLVGPDPVVAAKALLCRTLWIQGETGEALAVATDAVVRAQSIGHSVSLCAALYGACPVALWAGELELASRWVPMMRDEAARRGLLGWLRYADWFMQGLRLLQSQRDADAASSRQFVLEVAGRLTSYDAPRREMLLTFCDEWLDDALIARTEAGEGRWCAAEVWRSAGRREERRGDTGKAEDLYLRAIETAQRQGALAWKRRANDQLQRLRGK